MIQRGVVQVKGLGVPVLRKQAFCPTLSNIGKMCPPLKYERYNIILTNFEGTAQYDSSAQNFGRFEMRLKTLETKKCLKGRNT